MVIPGTVGTIWALLVLFIWHVHEKDAGSKRFVKIFAILTILAVTSILSAMSGIYLGVTSKSNLYQFSVVTSFIFIIVVGFYYLLMLYIVYVKSEE